MSNNTTNDTCPICNGHGRISNGRDPCDPAYDDGPCPHPDCEDGVIERPARAAQADAARSYQDEGHTCSYQCDRPACIRAQRDELAATLDALTKDAERYRWLVKSGKFCPSVNRGWALRIGAEIQSDPATDFCIEVESLIARAFNAKHGLSKPGEQPEPMWQVVAGIERAMRFRVGGDQIAKTAKATLRALEQEVAALALPPQDGRRGEEG